MTRNKANRVFISAPDSSIKPNKTIRMSLELWEYEIQEKWP